MTTKFIKRGERYAIASYDLLQNKALSPDTRLCIIWLGGHAESFEVRIGVMLSKLGISESVWLGRIRKELIKERLMRQKQKKGEGGKWIWEIEISDVPFDV